MTVFLIRRLFTMVISFLLMSLVIFIIIQLAPGDFITHLMAQMSGGGMRDEYAREFAENFRRLHGLDQPKWIQYFIWIRNFLTGDMGHSLLHGRPVATLLGDRLALSFGISFGSLVFTWLIGIPIGIYGATHKNTIGDHAATFVGFLGLSIPNFFLALVLMIFAVFALNWPVGVLFSMEYEDAPWNFGKALDLARNLWIPIVVIGTAGTAATIRVMRGNLLDMLGQPFVTTARSKGLKERIVVRRHAVRIAFNPFVSGLGMSLPTLLSGETITSIVLNLPTAGPLLFEALLAEDIYLSASILQFYAIFLLLGNLMADIALTWLDPRIRLE